jgi:lipid-binding SYLF domain-containing protein
MALGAFCVTAMLSALTAQAADNLEKESQEAVANFLQKDSTLKEFIDNAAGHAVFPNVAKGGLVVGGAHGSGVVYEKNKLIGQAKMTQASIGAQAGGQTFAEIICFETPDALNDFKAGKLEMSAEVSAVAAAEGVGKAAKYKKGVAVFALPKKGLMAQASVGGQKFKFEPIAAGGTGPSQGTEKGSEKGTEKDKQ